MEEGGKTVDGRERDAEKEGGRIEINNTKIEATWQRMVTYITRSIIPYNGDARDGITKDEGYICSHSLLETDSSCFAR